MSLEQDIPALIQPLIGGIVIWMDQNKPRPQLPYSAIKIMSVRQVNRDHYSNVDDDGIQTVSGDREFTLSVQRFQAFGVESVTEPLVGLVDKLRLNSVMDKFSAKGLVAFNNSAVTDISALLDKTQIEKRASVDIFMRYKSSIDDDVGIIEHVSVEGSDDGLNSPTYIIEVDI